MRKTIVSLLVMAVLFAGFAGTASARDLTGTFGIGADKSLSTEVSSHGLALTYYLHKYIGLQAIFSMDYNSDTTKVESDETTNSQTDWYVALRGLIPFAHSEQANLSGVIGLNVGGKSKSIKTGSQTHSSSYTTFWIDLGIRPEWFMTKHISVHTQIGISMFFKTKDYLNFSSSSGKKSNSEDLFGSLFQNKGDESGDRSGFRFSAFSGADLFGNAGVTFYF